MYGGTHHLISMWRTVHLLCCDLLTQLPGLCSQVPADLCAGFMNECEPIYMPLASHLAAIRALNNHVDGLADGLSHKWRD